MENNQKPTDRKVSLERLQDIRERLEKLKDTINLDKPGRVEVELDAIASDFIESGLVDPTHEALSLGEVLTKLKEKLRVPDEALQAAEQLGYLIEANWYGGDATSEKERERGGVGGAV